MSLTLKVPVLRGALTFDCPVFLSLARQILEMEPNGLKSSCKSVSRVSSDRLVTRIVALSSAVKFKHVNFRQNGFCCTIKESMNRASTHLFGQAAWTPLFACLHPSDSGAHTSQSCSVQAVQALVPLVKEEKEDTLAMATFRQNQPPTKYNSITQ